MAKYLRKYTSCATFWGENPNEDNTVTCEKPAVAYVKDEESEEPEEFVEFVAYNPIEEEEEGGL